MTFKLKSSRILKRIQVIDSELAEETESIDQLIDRIYSENATKLYEQNDKSVAVNFAVETTTEEQQRLKCLILQQKRKEKLHMFSVRREYTQKLREYNSKSKYKSDYVTSEYELNRIMNDLLNTSSEKYIKTLAQVPPMNRNSLEQNKYFTITRQSSAANRLSSYSFSKLSKVQLQILLPQLLSKHFYSVKAAHHIHVNELTFYYYKYKKYSNHSTTVHVTSQPPNPPVPSTANQITTNITPMDIDTVDSVSVHSNDSNHSMSNNVIDDMLKEGSSLIAKYYQISTSASSYTRRKKQNSSEGETAPSPAKRSAPSYWTDDEKNEFNRLLSVYGKDWSAISGQVKTKTTNQVRNYYQNYRHKHGLDRYLPKNHVGRKRRKKDATETTETVLEPVAYDHSVYIPTRPMTPTAVVHTLYPLYNYNSYESNESVILPPIQNLIYEQTESLHSQSFVEQPLSYNPLSARPVEEENVVVDVEHASSESLSSAVDKLQNASSDQ